MGYWTKNTCGSLYFFSNTLASFNPPVNNGLSFIESIFRVRGSRIFKNAVAWEWRLYRLRPPRSWNASVTWQKVKTKLCYFKILTTFGNPGSWPYNLNYWTGATQKGCKGQWAWCSGLSTSPLPENLTWGFNQPDNKAGGDDCIHMRLMQNTTGISLFDRNCSDKFVIACEVNIICCPNFLLIIIYLKGLPKLQDCWKPNCPFVNKTKNVSYIY
jgi:hypothetical protein